jgi:hypothetical protein
VEGLASDHDNNAAPLRSRRAMPVGGAVGALGAIGLEALVSAPQALIGSGFTSGFAQPSSRSAGPAGR